MKAIKQSSVPNIRAIIAQASESLGLYFPIRNFIASNPLKGLEDLPFDQAIKIAYEYYGGFGYLPKKQFIKAYNEGKIYKKNLIRSFSKNFTNIRNNSADYNILNLHKNYWDKLFEEPQEFEQISGNNFSQTNTEIIKLCAAFLDEGQAVWPLPYREQGFFKSIQSLIGKFNFSSSEECLKDLLDLLQISPEDWVFYLKDQLHSLPGWASFIKWRSDQNNYIWQKIAPINLTDYLAIRVMISHINNEDWVKLKPKAYVEFDEFIQGKIWLEAWEESYREELIKKLKSHQSENRSKAELQLIFCIDVRSEAYRRTIESLGNYQTYGFAGFFGLPIAIDSGCSQAVAHCPVLVEPKYAVKNSSKENKLYKKLKYLYFALKKNITTPFIFAEFLGLFCLFFMLIKTIYPKYSHKHTNPHKIEHNNIPLIEKYNYAYGFLTSIDLTNNFAEKIILCGHGSQTENNPYASGLDCGACGGNHGDMNAKIMADILNDHSIRDMLRKKNINIPANTIFIAAKHNTTTDEMTLLDQNEDNALKDLFSKARVLNCAKRSVFLDKAKSRENDWAQTRPEWGLARNAAFIVGPRSLTKNIDLEGRCFLHSYNYKNDQDGKILTAILTAPMVVAQWINSQYYFSSVDNVAYGSGSKITHNVVGKIGVMQGNASDLMHGLPLQSVMKNDDELYHEPLRLSTFVSAPRKILSKIIDNNQILQKLFYNEWVKLIVIEPSNNKFYLLSNGQWNEL